MLSRQKVRARVAYWQRRLGLSHWKIRVTFEPRERHAAHCWVDEQGSAFSADYIECELYFNLSKVSESPDGLDAFIIHEMVSHPTFWPLGAVAVKLAGKNKRLQRLVEQAEEQSAVMLERVLLAAFGLRGGS